MDGERFDALTQALVACSSRRRLLGILAGGIATALGVGHTAQARCPRETPINCGGTCVDLRTDPDNCGRCGASCGSGLCYSGRCLNTCPAGFLVSAGTCVRTCPAGTVACGGACAECCADADCSGTAPPNTAPTCEAGTNVCVYPCAAGFSPDDAGACIDHCTPTLTAAGCEVIDGKWVCPQGVDLQSQPGFPQVNLSGCDLRFAQLPNAYMPHSNFSGANLSGAFLNGAFALQVNLSSANLTGADLTNTNMDMADLSGANLTGAQVSGFWEGANLHGANLTGVIWGGTNCPAFQTHSNNAGGTCCGQLRPGDVPSAGC